MGFLLSYSNSPSNAKFLSSSTQTLVTDNATARPSRRLICIFRRYGCDASLTSMLDWKRHMHLNHMHLVLWRCGLDSCGRSPDMLNDVAVGPRNRGPSNLKGKTQKSSTLNIIEDTMKKEFARENFSPQRQQPSKLTLSELQDAITLKGGSRHYGAYVLSVRTKSLKMLIAGKITWIMLVSTWRTETSTPRTKKKDFDLREWIFREGFPARADWRMEISWYRRISDCNYRRNVPW